MRLTWSRGVRVQCTAPKRDPFLGGTQPLWWTEFWSAVSTWSTCTALWKHVRWSELLLHDERCFVSFLLSIPRRNWKLRNQFCLSFSVKPLHQSPWHEHVILVGRSRNVIISGPEKKNVRQSTIEEFLITQLPWKPVQLDGHLDWLHFVSFQSLTDYSLRRSHANAQCLSMYNCSSIENLIIAHPVALVSIVTTLWGNSLLHDSHHPC